MALDLVGVLGLLAAAIDNVERIRKTFKAAKAIPNEIPAVEENCKKMQRVLHEHPGMDTVSQAVRDQVAGMAVEIAAISRKYCHKDSSSGTNAPRRNKLADKFKTALHSVEFPSDILATFREANALLVRVLEEVNNSMLTDLWTGLGARTLRDVTNSPAAVDNWIGGNSSLPRKKTFMLGPDELASVAKIKKAVIYSYAEDAVASVAVQGSGGVGKTVACLVVAHDKEVAKLYPDATLWIKLGIDVTAATVVDELARAVEETGGGSTA
jgi:hypothetical protein